MPCYVTGSARGDAELFAAEDRESLNKARKEVKQLTRLLCEACNRLGGNVPVSKELVRWAKIHRTLDEARKKRKKRK